MADAVSILVLAYNKAAYTRRCLNSLLKSTLRPFEVVLIDNGSTDETPQVFKDFKARAQGEKISVSTLVLDKNHGAIVGRNRGMELMHGNYWVFMDNDIVVRSRDWMQKLRAVLDADEKAGVVSPKLVYASPPHNIQCAGCAVTKGGQVVFCGRGRPKDDPEFNAPRECQTLISAVWMLRADAARKIGPLDEQFSPVQFEDIDYCYRLREAGYTCRYEPGVELYHFENVTSGGSGTINYPYITVKNGMKFKTKWRHRFSREAGPDDKDWAWATVPAMRIEDVPEELETV